MKTWHTPGRSEEQLQILEFGCEENGLRAKWGPGRRNFYIIHYVLEGIGYFNGIRVGENQGFLLHPMQSVEYHPDPGNPWKYFWVSFEGEAAERICQNHICANENGIFDYNFRPVITALLTQLKAREKILGELYALSVFYQILSGHEAGVSLVKNRYVDQAMHYIDLNFHRQLTVEEIAAACNIGDRYLYNLFIKHAGISPKQYLDKVRIENAKALLSGSGCTVTEAAVSVGFADVLAFSRFFSKHTGMSPTAFRKTALRFDFC